MRDLRTRIMLLAGLVALVTALACTLAANAVAQRNLVEAEDRLIAASLDSLRRQLTELLGTLSYEVTDYANWDELYAHMPRPEREWAAVNLTPGRPPGGLTQFMVVGGQQRVCGRFRQDDQRDERPSPDDPASAASLVPLLAGERPVSGIGVFDGHPALFASAPVLKSDRTGPSRGHLVCLAYFTPEILARCTVHGFTLAVAGRPAAPTSPVSWSLGEAVISRQGTTLALEVPVTTFDGTLTLFLEHQETMGGRGRMTLAIAGAGLLVAVLVSLAGVVLGWWWLRPIQRLATACRATGDDAPDLATDSGLREADRLAHAFNQRLAIERRARQHLAEALEREATAHAVQRRFLANLGHELGQPLHRLIGLTSRLTAQAQPPAPEQLSELRLCAVALDERFQEILGLVGESAVEPGLGQRLHLRRYLAGLIDQLQPQAQAKGLELAGVAPDEECFIPTRLLTPVLVNLAANALRATNAGRVTLSVEVQPGSIVWTVSDTGPGIEAALAERITDSCRRGEVMPGTTGLGLGLTMAMANLRSLGGRLELAANGPQGVCFRATVPVM